MRTRILTALFALAVTSAHAQTLRVAAAADLTPVLPPVLAEFEHETGIHAEASFQSSAVLSTQIQNGAPFDLFLAADTSFPQKVADGGFADAAKPTVYARGTLVLWTRKDSAWPQPTLALLKDPRLTRLAVANPDRAPYGRAAIAALTSLGLYDALKSRIVTADNIAQTAQFADSANAQAGLISLTSAKTAKLAADGNYALVPRNLYPPIEQGAVVLKASSEKTAAHKLLDFLLSPKIQAELAEHGLTPVNGAR